MYVWPQLIKAYYICPWAFLVAQSVKNLPAIRETWVRSLGWEDSLEKKMAIHSSIPAAKFHGQGDWWATVHGVAELDTTKQLSTHTAIAQN